MKLSGWCSPNCSPRSHVACQDRLERGLLDRCDCPNHVPVVTELKGHVAGASHEAEEAVS